MFFNFNKRLFKRNQFCKKTLQLKDQKISVEVADTPEKQEHGLMFRQTLKDNQGMLFVFSDEEIRHFWMKNTFIDLDIGYFSRDGCS